MATEPTPRIETVVVSASAVTALSDETQLPAGTGTVRIGVASSREWLHIETRPDGSVIEVPIADANRDAGHELVIEQHIDPEETGAE